jgi:hypothetical protein
MLNNETLDKLNDPKFIAMDRKHNQRMEALYAGEDDSPDLYVLYGTSAGLDLADESLPLEEKLDTAMTELADAAERLTDEKTYRPLILNADMFGVHYIDNIFARACFGIETKWGHRANEFEVGSLKPFDLDSDPYWQAAQEATLKFLEYDTPLVRMTPICLANSLNTGMNLYGQSLLMAMYDNPEGVKNDFQLINDVIVTMNAWYRDNVPPDRLSTIAGGVRLMPSGFGHLDGCSTQMLSPDLYDEFVRDLDDAITSVWPRGAMQHLCGSHTQHLPTWSKLESFKAFQLCDGPNAELDVYYTESRDDQIIYVGPTWRISMERIMDITGGWRVILADDLYQKFGELPQRAPKR